MVSTPSRSDAACQAAYQAGRRLIAPTCLAVAVALSLLISLDRLLKVAKYGRLVVKEWASGGHRPEHNFIARRLPDPHRDGTRFPYVAVQVRPALWSRPGRQLCARRADPCVLRSSQCSTSSQVSCERTLGLLAHVCVCTH